MKWSVNRSISFSFVVCLKSKQQLTTSILLWEIESKRFYSFDVKLYSFSKNIYNYLKQKVINNLESSKNDVNKLHPSLFLVFDYNFVIVHRELLQKEIIKQMTKKYLFCTPNNSTDQSSSLWQ